MRRVVRLPRRALGVLTDQLVWSLNSLLASLLVARGLSVGDFGAYAAGLVLLLLALGFGRALFGQPLILRWSGSSRDDVRRAAGVGLRPVLWYGAASAIVAVAVLPVLGHGAATAWVALALVPLAVQDFLRMAGLAAGAVSAVLAMDVVWLVGQTGGLLVVTRRDSLTVALAWQIGAAALAASVVIGLVALRPVRRDRSTVAAARSWRLSLTLGGDFAVSSGLVLVLMALLPLVTGAAGLAALRGAQTVAGPLQVLQAGVDGALLPEASRRARRTWTDGVSLCVAVALLAGTAGTVLSGALLLLPDRVGTAMLGDTWLVAAPLLPPVLLRACLALVAVAAVVALRSTGDATAAFRLRVVTAPLLVLAAVIGALLGSAVGFAWGLTVAQALSTALWWLAVHHSRPSTGRHAVSRLTDPAGPVGGPRVHRIEPARRRLSAAALGTERTP